MVFNKGTEERGYVFRVKMVRIYVHRQVQISRYRGTQIPHE
jgi:hypothetical protein